MIYPSHALNDPNVSGSKIGPEAYKRQVLRFLKGFPDARMTIVDIVGENEKTVVAWTFSGSHDGEIMGNPATHKKVSVDGITIHHFANGKVIDSYASWDLQSLTKQLGGTISQYRLIEFWRGIALPPSPSFSCSTNPFNNITRLCASC